MIRSVGHLLRGLYRKQCRERLGELRDGQEIGYYPPWPIIVIYAAFISFVLFQIIWTSVTIGWGL